MTFLQLLLMVALVGAMVVFAYRKGRKDASGQEGPARPRQSEEVQMPKKSGPAIAPPVSSGGRTPEATTVSRRTTPTLQRQPVDVLPADSASPAAMDRKNRPPGIKSWGYQLQNLNLARAEASPFDLLVIDYAKDGSDDTALKPTEVARLKRKPDGGRRIVLAYLSIGEAESYRTYWDVNWERKKPRWLLGENPEWKENYAVCFWEPEWQEIMCGAPRSRIDLIIEAGFDGVYLDKCDVYEDLRAHNKRAFQSRPDIQGDMVAFITNIAADARQRNPNFMVVMQNAETLLESAALRRTLDGVAKEELLFGNDGTEKPNEADDVAWTRDRLDRMRKEGKLVLVVEYLQAPAKIHEAARQITELGYTLYIAPKDRLLSRLNYETLQA